jgi:hypothetical protein
MATKHLTSIFRTAFDKTAKMASTAKFQLPEGFLGGPAPNLRKFNINWEKGGMPEYARLWAVVLDGVMTKEECDLLVAAAEATTNATWERAMVNVGGGRQALYSDLRNCGRIIWDDHDIVAKLWTRIESSVPEIHHLQNWPAVTGNGPTKRDEVWKVTRLNERMRFLKYTGGEYFKGQLIQSEQLKTLLTPKSTLRWYIRNTRPQGTVVLYPTPLPQRRQRKGGRRTTRRRGNHFPFDR